jgi:hypothetical protein
MRSGNPVANGLLTSNRGGSFGLPELFPVVLGDCAVRKNNQKRQKAVE